MEPIRIDNAHLMFKNFSGAPGMYNEEGKRKFSIEVDEQLANELAEMGINVRTTKPKNADYFPTKYVDVSVGQFVRMARAYFSDGTYDDLRGDKIGDIDHYDLEKVDVIVKPTRGSYRGRDYTKLWLNEIHVFVRESPYERAYSGYRPRGAAAADDNLPFNA